NPGSHPDLTGDVLRMDAERSPAGNEFHFVSLDYEASQSTGSIRTGIYVDAVRANLRLRHRCVSVHNNFFETSFVIEKIIADREQIVLALVSQRDARAHSSMHKEEVLTDKRNSELVEKLEVSTFA